MDTIQQHKTQHPLYTHTHTHGLEWTRLSGRFHCISILSGRSQSQCRRQPRPSHLTVQIRGLTDGLHSSRSYQGPPRREQLSRKPTCPPCREQLSRKPTSLRPYCVSRQECSDESRVWTADGLGASVWEMYTGLSALVYSCVCVCVCAHSASVMEM